MKCKLKFALLCLCLALNYATLVSSECAEHFFDCKNGKCIANFFQCDDDNDCGNFEDEMNCFEVNNITTNVFHTAKACPDDHFACHDEFSTCLPNRWVCDGMKECANGADELNCTLDKVDCGDDFKCTNFQCIPKAWQCDGISDCDDISDETNCTTFKKTELCDKEHGMFQCSSGECIPYSKVCDKHQDCLHGDDEGMVCQSKACHEKKCPNNMCNYDTNTNTSTCYCPPGFHLLNDTCLDFNECADNKLTNMCSQRCVNLEGSYKCECFDQYQMINSTCQIKGESPVLYFSTGNEIRALDLRTQAYYRVVETKHSSELLVGMDMIVDQQKLFYFGSEDASHGCVYEVSIAGGKQLKTEVELLFHEDIQGIEGISVDWLANHFYITEASNNKILVCNIGSVYCATLLDNLNSPRGILTMPSKGKLFWTQWGGKPGIFQAGMDGLGSSPLIEDVAWPNDLALDEEMDRLYWCDGKEGSIEYYDFELQVRHLVFKDHNRQPYALAVFEDNLYWSDWATNQVEVCNKISGHHMKPLVMDARDRFFGLYVYHPQVQKLARMRPHNPCDINPCSHLCLLQANATAFTCHCPDHMVLSSNGHTCQSKIDEPFVLVSTGQKVIKYYINSITSTHSEELQILPIFHIAEIAFNFDREELYIHDLHKNRIGLLDLNRNGHLQWKNLVDDNLNGVMSLAYDVNTDNIYWVDMTKGTLEAASTLGKGRAILNNELKKPISLAISPRNRKFYIGQHSSPSEIVMLDMDGKSKQTLIISPTGFPLTIATDGGSQLIWGDPILQKIEFIEIKNDHPVNQPHKLINSDVQTISSLAVANETIYWTNTESYAFYYSPLGSSNKRSIYHKRLETNNVNLDLLKVTVGAKQKTEYDYCLAGRHKCTHLCLINVLGAVCKCADGFSSTDGGLTCVKSPPVSTPPTKTFIQHIDPESFFKTLTGPFKSSSDDSKIQWMVWTPNKNATQKNNTASNVSLPVKVISNITTASSQTDKDAVNGRNDDQSSPVANFFWKLVLFLFVAFTGIFLYFWVRSPTLRNRIGETVGLKRGDSKTVRFIRNPNYEPEFVVETETPESNRSQTTVQVGDNNNPFK